MAEVTTRDALAMKIAETVINKYELYTRGAGYIAAETLNPLAALISPLLPEGDGWIPCAERLPEPDTDVLIWNSKGFIETGHLDISGGGGIVMRPLTGPDEILPQWPAWNVPSDSENYHEATHWRPLPSPPAEEPA